MIITYFIIGLLISVTLALLEIQIEGKNGWAEKLPTWRIYRKWFKYIPGGNKPITGYHFYLWLFTFLYPHSAFLFTPWNIGKELIIISLVLFILRLEDFLWFVLNPTFGLKKFNKENISWHKDWFGFFPTQYYYSAIIWAILFFIGLNLL